MRQPVGDRSAIRFSVGFYRAVAAVAEVLIEERSARSIAGRRPATAGPASWHFGRHPATANLGRRRILRRKAGKRVRRKVTGRTKTEVKAKLRELRRDLDSGIRSSATYTVGAALDDWLANGLSGRSDRTKELYQDTVKPPRKRLGEVKLRELTAGDVQETLDALASNSAQRRIGGP